MEQNIYNVVFKVTHAGGSGSGIQCVTFVLLSIHPLHSENQALVLSYQPMWNVCVLPQKPKSSYSQNKTNCILTGILSSTLIQPAVNSVLTLLPSLFLDTFSINQYFSVINIYIVGNNANTQPLYASLRNVLRTYFNHFLTLFYIKHSYMT